MSSFSPSFTLFPPFFLFSLLSHLFFYIFSSLIPQFFYLHFLHRFSSYFDHNFTFLAIFCFIFILLSLSSRSPRLHSIILHVSNYHHLPPPSFHNPLLTLPSFYHSQPPFSSVLFPFSIIFLWPCYSYPYFHSLPSTVSLFSLSSFSLPLIIFFISYFPFAPSL